MIKKLLSGIFSLTLLATGSCMESPTSGFRFGKEVNLTGTTVLVTDSVFFRYPYRIRQADSLLYILDLHGPDFFCHALTYPLMGMSASMAKKGNGPEEYLSVLNIRLGKDGETYLLDSNNQSIRKYESIKDSIGEKIHLSEELIRSLDFALIDDSLFAIPDYSGKYRINIVDGNGNIQEQLFNIPTKNKKDENLSDIVLAQAWRSFLDYNPENGILAMATQLGQVLEIYNLKTVKPVRILYGQLGEPVFVNQGEFAVPDGIMGYGDVQVCKDKIYTIFWGSTIKSIRENPQGRKEGGNIIQVFSLEGKPLVHYTLDHYITGFTVDEKNNRIFALDVNQDQPVVEYQL